MSDLDILVALKELADDIDCLLQGPDGEVSDWRIGVEHLRDGMRAITNQWQAESDRAEPPEGCNFPP